MVYGDDGFVMLECSNIIRWIWGNYSANDELQYHISSLISIGMCLLRE